MKHSQPGSNSKDLFWPAIIVFFVGMHSIVLGLIIYFFTDFFYQVFFAASVDNLFFVRQSGIFLFLAGFFYLYPLVNLRSLYNLLLLVIFSKIVAVYFLIANAGYTAAPAMIYLAAFFDGLMALVLVGIYFHVKKTASPADSRILPTEEAGLNKAA
ncbi:MAG: hypothetical protein R3297_05540 [Desulfobulbales bacterium]|nr:hypothetical protein [Desulfobulbales bacterium]